MFSKKKKPLSEYSSWELIGYRFRKNKLAMLGVFMFVLIVAVTIIAPFFIPYEEVISQDVRNRLQAGSISSALMNLAGICLPEYFTAAGYRSSAV